jgi:hypothetical protein
MRNAISGLSAALPWSRSERVARHTLRTSGAFGTLRPRASMTSVLITSPGYGGFLIGIVNLAAVIISLHLIRGLAVLGLGADGCGWA